MAFLEKNAQDRATTVLENSENSISKRVMVTRFVASTFFWRKSARETLLKIRDDEGQPEALRKHLDLTLTYM